MVYRVVLICNGEYKKTIHQSRTRETSFIHYNSLINNNNVKFPKRFINTNKITPAKFQIYVTKPTEPTDTFRMLRDKYGKLYQEKPLGDWTILASHDYDVEETFWVLGMNSKANRPTIDIVVKKLVTGAFKKNMVKQIIVVHNKLIIYNEDQFDMILCKCKDDAQRLHHTLAKVAKKQKIKNLLFMGTSSKATIYRMYDLIMLHSGWPIEKVRRTSTRP